MPRDSMAIATKLSTPFFLGNAASGEKFSVNPFYVAGALPIVQRRQITYDSKRH